MTRKITFLLLAILICINCYSQIKFEKGYYIDNNNNKNECLIKNLDWKNNPTDFEYKLSENTQSQKADINSIQEFGIYNTSRYIRNTVKIDRSSDNINNLDDNENLIFKEEQLFLKVLVEGKANLYIYEDGNLIRYFYNKKDSDIEQLVYKIYKTNRNNIGRNKRYKQQLWKNLKCPTITLDHIKKLNYKRKSLTTFFIRYNGGDNSNLISYENKKKKDLFNLSIRPRLNNNSLSIENPTGYYKNLDFGNKLGFGIGIEAEFIFPFNKNKWSVLLEPTYQNFRSEKAINVNNVNGGQLITKVDYSSIEIPVSLRHYFFINNGSKVFVNISFIFDINSKSKIDLKRADNSTLNSLKIASGNNLALGVGYKFYDKYSLEMRYQTNRTVLGNYPSWGSEYKTFSVIFGYSIF